MNSKKRHIKNKGNRIRDGKRPFERKVKVAEEEIEGELRNQNRIEEEMFASD